MKFRYPITIIAIAATIITTIASYRAITHAEYNDTASLIASICGIAIVISFWWIIAITAYKIIRKSLAKFKRFLFELIDKIKE